MDWPKLVMSIVICLAVGFTSGFFTNTGEGSWYSQIEKPSFNPPNWLFSPVWTLLYVLMGIVLYYLWVNNAKTALLFFLIQLVLNFAWSFLFFTLQSPLIAFIEIVILLLMIIATAVLSYPVARVTLYLLLPYIAWVSFAAMLNFSIVLLNR